MTDTKGLGCVKQWVTADTYEAKGRAYAFVADISPQRIEGNCSTQAEKSDKIAE